MRHVALPTAVLAMLLAFSSVSAAPPGPEDAPEIVVGVGTAPGDYCQGVSILGWVGCALPSFSCGNIRYFDLRRVAVDVTLPTGPAMLLTNEGALCNRVYDFPEGSCTGGLALDITCEHDGWTMFLADDGDISWKHASWAGRADGGHVVRSDVSADVLPALG